MKKNLLILLMAAIILGGVTNIAKALAPATIFDDQIPEEAAILLPPDNELKNLDPLSVVTVEPQALPNTQMLVNPLNTLPPEFIPEGLVGIKSFVRSNGNVLLRADAARALQEMLDALKAAGFTDIYASSGYRNFARQRELHTAKVAFYRREGADEATARAQAARWVLPPGESEHQTGLALDFSTASLGYDLIEAFAQTAAGRWLTEHCVEYGFIVRYTKEKEPFTGVASEPWHFRYVGADHAFYMRQHNLCLEEYHALLQRESPLLFENAQGKRRAVHYATGDISASLPGVLLTVSLARYGDADYIITLEPEPPPIEPLFDALGHWGEPFIMRMHGLGVVNGYLDGSFHPDDGVSRGEFITAFSRLPLAIFADKPPDAAPENQEQDLASQTVILPYADVDPEKYYYHPLQVCYRASLVQVLEKKDAQPLLFEANKPLLRGETALLLAQALSSGDSTLASGLSYFDVPPVSGQLYNCVELLTARGVFSGDGDGLFHPERGVSRAEMSAMFCRLLDTVMQEEASPQTSEAAALDADIKVFSN